MITVIRSSKKKRLYQWDLDRQIKIVAPEGIEVNEAHFAHLRDAEALVVKIKNVEGKLVADVPNILLQSCEKIRVWLVSDDQTIFSDILIVIQRAKPVDYVYKETEIKNYDALEKRIKALEENGGGGGNGKPGADGFSPIASVEQTADGAEITITDKKGTTKATVKNGKDGLKGKDGINGEDGYTPVKGKDYFTDADKQELIQSVFAQVVNGNEVAY